MVVIFSALSITAWANAGNVTATNTGRRSRTRQGHSASIRSGQRQLTEVRFRSESRHAPCCAAWDRERPKGDMPVGDGLLSDVIRISRN